ncbi:MAG: hypothetical protein RLP09_06585 [Sandaracinaceae bacterium]
MRSWARVALGLVLAACAAPVAEPDSAAGPDASAGECVVGTGVEEFIPIEPGDELALIAGPQGGYHVFSSVRVRGFIPPPVRIAVTLRRADDDRYLGPTLTVGESTLREASDGWREAFGLLSLVNDPSDARGQEVVLRSVVSDASGALLHADERRVRVR